MLIEFKVTNFRSFRDTQTFSMVASADQSLPENTIETPVLGKQRLLRSTVMYGANASGKSNLLKALEFLQILIRNSTERKPNKSTGVKPFMLEPTQREQPTEFEVTFIENGVRYHYGLSLDTECIHSEWMIAYPNGARQVWYERTLNRETKNTSWYFGPRYTGERQRLTKLTRDDVPFLSVAAAFNHDKLSVVYKWFSQKLIVFDVSFDDRLNLQFTTKLADDFSEVQKNVDYMITLADLGISGFSWKLKDRERDNFDIEDKYPGLLDGISKYDIDIHHLTSEGDTVNFSIEEESVGTKRYYGMLGLWIATLSIGGTLFVDELDASLHSVLVRTLIRLFHDPEINKNNAQLIFNTHDTTLMDTSLFRRDQFWFVEKDRAGASHIYSLLEYSPRKDEALERGYLQGRYGAIPDVRGLLDLELTRG